MNENDVYVELKGHFDSDSQVIVNHGKGAQGIKYENKMFIMFYKGDLVIKLSPDRIQQLISTGDGLAFDPGTGKAMKDRILIPYSNEENWILLAEESKNYVIG